MTLTLEIIRIVSVTVMGLGSWKVNIATPLWCRENYGKHHNSADDTINEDEVCNIRHRRATNSIHERTVNMMMRWHIVHGQNMY